MRATLLAIREELSCRRHDLVRVQGNGSNVWWRLLQLPRGTGEPDTSWRFSFGGVPSMAASPQTS